MTIPRHPGVDFRAYPACAREVEEREEEPHERTLPQEAAKGEEPTRHGPVWSNGEHGMVKVGVKELWKTRVNLRPCVRVMQAQRPAQIECSADPERPYAEPALSVVDHI